MAGLEVHPGDRYAVFRGISADQPKMEVGWITTSASGGLVFRCLPDGSEKDDESATQRIVGRVEAREVSNVRSWADGMVWKMGTDPKYYTERIVACIVEMEWAPITVVRRYLQPTNVTWRWSLSETEHVAMAMFAPIPNDMSTLHLKQTLFEIYTGETPGNRGRQIGIVRCQHGVHTYRASQIIAAGAAYLLLC